MYAVLAVLGIIAVVFGALSLSNATLGVGIIAIGVFLGVLARISQAERYHKEQASWAKDRAG